MYVMYKCDNSSFRIRLSADVRHCDISCRLHIARGFTTSTLLVQGNETALQLEYLQNRTSLQTMPSTCPRHLQSNIGPLVVKPSIFSLFRDISDDMMGC